MKRKIKLSNRKVILPPLRRGTVNGEKVRPQYGLLRVDKELIGKTVNIILEVSE